jgi:hypothetical protein
MRDRILAHLRAVVAAHLDLAESLPDQALRERMGVPSNAIGAQFWCIIGGRESYTAAIAAGRWSGFTCSLGEEAAFDRQAVIAALGRTAGELDRTVEGLEWTDARDDLLLDLLEHETQHQGQLIRYVYALPYHFPQSWIDRWALRE